jgi:hypothetical protein
VRPLRSRTPAVAGSKAGTWRHRAPFIKDQHAATHGRGAYGPELTRPWSSPSSPSSCLFAGDEQLGMAGRDALSGGLSMRSRSVVLWTFRRTKVTCDVTKSQKRRTTAGSSFPALRDHRLFRASLGARQHRGTGRRDPPPGPAVHADQAGYLPCSCAGCAETSRPLTLTSLPTDKAKTGKLPGSETVKPDNSHCPF